LLRGFASFLCVYLFVLCPGKVAEVVVPVALPVVALIVVVLIVVCKHFQFAALLATLSDFHWQLAVCN